MRNIALKLMYNGTAYHGWQVQKKRGHRLRDAGEGHRRHLRRAGPPDRLRPDRRRRPRGALHRQLPHREPHPLDRLPFAINTHTPEDIAVKEAFEVAEDFNAIGSCIKKEYTYRIYNSGSRTPSM